MELMIYCKRNPISELSERLASENEWLPCQGNRVVARLLASTGGDGNHAGGACDFDVVVRGSRIKARALEPDVVAHIAEGLIIEDECGDPALEVRSGGDAHRASNENLRCSPADPYGNHARGIRELQVGHAESSLDLQPGEIEAVKPGFDLRGSALDDEPP